MQAFLLPFTATGILSSAPTQVAGVGVGSGVTSIDVYNGSDATGTLVARVTATTSFAVPVACPNGVYVVLTGTGKASLWVR